LIFFPISFAVGQLVAIRPGAGETKATPQIVWKLKRGVSNKPSILLVDDLIYMIGDTGIASCTDSKTGEPIWQHRIGGEYSASPLYAQDHLWFFSEDGKTTILKPGRTFAQVAENRLDEGFMASPAAAGKALYLRTRTHLYRIQDKSPLP
jgi:outer membrane protein assembly factor BamB